MPPFRNPFGKKPPNVNGITPDQDENIPPTRPNGLLNQGKDGTTASRTSSTLSIKPNKDEPNEFKLSGKRIHYHGGMLRLWSGS